jgi:hypothetical protein
MLWFITRAMSAVEVLFRDPRSFPELAVGRGYSRSERREAIVRVLKCLLYFMDLLSLRVGFRRDDRCLGITERKIAEWTGLSSWRVDRALTDLRRAGFVFSVQPRTITDGQYFGLAAVRTVARSLFRRLGLGTTLALEQKRAYKRRQEGVCAASRRTVPPSPSAPLRAVIGHLARATSWSKADSKADPIRGPEDPNLRMRWFQLCFEIRRAQPDWEPDKIRAEASRRLC